jgi:hypothetical protein
VRDRRHARGYESVFGKAAAAIQGEIAPLNKVRERIRSGKRRHDRRQ